LRCQSGELPSEGHPNEIRVVLNSEIAHYWAGTLINSSIERCFDLSRDIELHMRSTVQTGEIAIAGVTKGLINLGEQVTWEAKHFGMRQRLTTKITGFRCPFHFRDSQVRGAFKRFDHDHYFETVGEGKTLMKDIFDYTSPPGWFGVLADHLLLTSYMRTSLSNAMP
jgi:ligand-binding SRPBCC domain-containing protein